MEVGSISNIYDKVVKLGDFVENIDRVFGKFVNKISVRREEFAIAIKDLVENEGLHIYTKYAMEVPHRGDVIKLERTKQWSIYWYKSMPMKIYWDSNDDDVEIVIPAGFSFEEITKRANKYLKIDKEVNITDNFATETFYYSGAQKSIVNSIQFWLSKRDWFLERGIPYKRTYLLKGPPGTGKSSFIRRVASVIGYNTYALDVVSEFGRQRNKNKNTVKSFDDGDEEEVITPSSSSSGLKRDRQILVVEDLDRVNLENIRMDKFMNYLQGSESREGLICFITCNNDLSLPDALLRAGRVDKEVTFGRFEDEGLLFIANKVFNESRKHEILNLYKTKNKEILNTTESKINELKLAEIPEDKKAEIQEKIEELGKAKDRLLKEIYTPAHFEKFCVDIAIGEFEEQARNL